MANNSRLSDQQYDAGGKIIVTAQDIQPFFNGKVFSNDIDPVWMTYQTIDLIEIDRTEWKTPDEMVGKDVHEGER